MSRRAAGEGSVFQRTDGRWQASLQLAGKRKTVYAKTRKEALRKLDELRRQASALGTLPDPGRRTVDDLLTAWLETVSPNLKPSTAAHYRLMADTYLRPALGDIPLGKLTPTAIQRMCTELQGQGRHRTAQLAYHLLKQACGLATMWGWLPEDPCQRVLRPQYHPQRKALWSPEEVAIFIEGARGHRLYPLWVLALASGCRLGELLALSWPDVDWPSGALHIRHTLQRVGKAYQRWEPKTAAGHRTVAIPPFALNALRQQRATQEAWRARHPNWANEWDLVFTTETGAPLHRAVVCHELAEACAKLGVAAMTPHGLRHLHASLLLSRGLSVPAVSARLGHAHPAVTLSIYAHAIERDGAEAALAIEGCISTGKEG